MVFDINEATARTYAGARTGRGRPGLLRRPWSSPLCTASSVEIDSMTVEHIQDPVPGRHEDAANGIEYLRDEMKERRTLTGEDRHDPDDEAPEDDSRQPLDHCRPSSLHVA